MKIQVDGKTVYELSETQKKVIKNDIPDEIFQEDIERRVRYIVEHKYERCMERLKAEWTPRLAQVHQSLPTNNDQLAEVIFAQREYKRRSQREKEYHEQMHKNRTNQA